MGNAAGIHRCGQSRTLSASPAARSPGASGGVTNMPAAVPHTSTFALNNATFPYLLELANRGIKGASKALLEGVNTFEGNIVYQAVAESQGKPWKTM